MERTKSFRKADAIFTSDWHLRESIPICRTDNYWKAMWRKIDSIAELQRKNDCVVLHAGDFYDHWKPSPFLLRTTIKHIPDQFYTLYGQHDLPQHNLQLVDKCGINVLEIANRINVLDGAHWGQTPSVSMRIKGRKILVWHKFNYQGKRPWPGCTAPTANKLLRDYPEYDVILTGDNHQSFYEKQGNGLVVNPGSIMRMDADQHKQKPCVFLWYAKENIVVQHILPHEPGVITREHIERTKQREIRIDAYISKLKSDWKASLSFKQNLERFKEENHIPTKVIEIIYKAMDYEH